MTVNYALLTAPPSPLHIVMNVLLTDISHNMKKSSLQMINNYVMIEIGFEHYEDVTVCLTLYGSNYWFTD